MAKFIGVQYGFCSFFISASASPSAAISEKQKQKIVTIVKTFFVAFYFLILSRAFFASLWPFTAAFLYHSAAFSIVSS